MFKKIINFIKYHNAFAVVIAVAFLAVTSAMASDEVRNVVLGEEIVEKSGLDNSVLLAIDLDNFDLEMEITGVAEDVESLKDPKLSEDSESNKTGNYYIDYEYKTLGIQDDIWQEIFRQKQLVISKEALRGRDLGLYVTEELGEIIDYEIAYLKEVQENEQEKGETLIVETTKYTGLIGLVLDTKTKELPGYEPVVKPPVAEEIPASDGDEIPPAPFDKEGDGEIAGDYPLDSYYYQFLINNCLSNGGYWYNNACNDEPEVVESDDNAPHPDPLSQREEGDDNSDNSDNSDDTPVCDSDNLDLCDTQELCEEMELYWYYGECHVEEEEIVDDAPHSNPLPMGEGDDNETSSDEGGGDGEIFYSSEGDDGESSETSAFICDADHPTLCEAEEICGEMGLYWYGGECHVEEEAVVDEVVEEEATDIGATNATE